jgi:hypothetical protein
MIFFDIKERLSLYLKKTDFSKFMRLNLGKFNLFFVIISTMPRNSYFRYLPEENFINESEIAQIEEILHKPVEDISELSELVNSEVEPEDSGLEA